MTGRVGRPGPGRNGGSQPVFLGHSTLHRLGLTPEYSALPQGRPPATPSNSGRDRGYESLPHRASKLINAQVLRHCWA